MLIYHFLLIFTIISLNHAIVQTDTNRTKHEISTEPASITTEVEGLKTFTANLEKQLSDLKASRKTQCVIDVQNVSELQPLLVSLTLTWPTYEINKAGKMIIPEGDEFFLVCPTNFRNLTEKYVTATCVGGTNIMINGVLREFSDMQCTKEVQYSIKGTSIKCLPGDTQKVEVLYDLFSDRTIEVLEVCIDKSWAHGLYAKNIMQRSFGNEHYNTIFSDDDLSDELSGSCELSHRCCYATRQLVSHKDVFPGVAQKAVFHYHYKICHDKNWDDVEHRIRSLLKSSSNNLVVWSGAKYAYGKHDVKYYSDYSLVPNYIWKVVQDPGTNSSLAIIQVNMPLYSSPRSTLCPDVCNQTEWMKGSNWADITRGYTYCCSIEEFEKAFGFYNVFNNNLDSILIGS